MLGGESFSAEFNMFIVRWVMTNYNERNHVALKKIGLTPEQLSDLKDLTMENLNRLSSFKTFIADVSFDSNRFDLMMDHVKREGVRDTIIDHCVKLEASSAMLEELIGMHRHEFRERRILLGLPKAVCGRPRALSESEAMLVHSVWRRYETIDDLLTRYYYVGLETGLPLSQIWAHMKANDISRPLCSGAADIIVDKCIKLEASQAMMEELVGMSRLEYRQRRLRLGLPKAVAGRPRELSEVEHMSVKQAWIRHANSNDLITRYCHIGTETGLPLSLIWTHLKASGIGKSNAVNE